LHIIFEELVAAAFISRNVVVGRIGSYTVDDLDCYFLVKWIEELQEVKEDGRVMVGATGGINCSHKQ
jgi:hypothetical protein